jgi:hypothetical protein
MTRYGADGKTYGENEVTPLIYKYSDFPFDADSHEKLVAALDAFDALPQEKIEAYSNVKRALLHRHLWAVFDHSMHVMAWRKRDSRGRPELKTNPVRTQKQLVSLVQRLALTRAEILTRHQDGDGPVGRLRATARPRTPV